MAGLTSGVVQIATVLLVILGIATGLMLPSLLTTWLAMLFLVISVMVLLLGTFVMDVTAKIFLIVAFPGAIFLTSSLRAVVGSFGWLTENQHNVAAFTKNYHPGLNLQRSYNARKIFEKAVTRFNGEPGLADMSLDVTGIQWAHSEQYQQFNPEQYNDVLAQAANVLKERRLPSEFLYILDDDMLLIVSFRLPRETYDYLTAATKIDLASIRVGDFRPQFQWGHKYITTENMQDYQTLDDAIKHIRRDMETDLVTEYMKKGTLDD
ncbi:hypothetical protein B6254_2247 [Weissella cibaria]|uniref:Uncharacterized protein n=1 Tax=Weissella cibaria TaxID=137591 RepID=A0A2S1KU96_9LACO|nr:hypothetical protein B6254_2247 [Weissella cibaria]